MSDERLRLSFGGIAEHYERGRPEFADEAVAWVASRLPFGRVLDLAAGTGKLTRQLVAYADEVVAVEPADGMRRVLEREVPGVEALAGTAEEIPLPDASVDAITVAQAFHWFRADEALAEMHRVLRPGGGFALLWNVWRGDDPALRRMGEIVDVLGRPHGAGPGWRDRYDRSLFGELEERTFVQERRLTAETLAEWAASTSAVALSDAETRARVDAEVRALAGDGAVGLAIPTQVVVADRV